MLKENICQ
jgi:putative transposase